MTPNSGTGVCGEATPVPAYYLDEIAVERRCDGDRTVSLSRYEAAAAMRRLHTQGLSARAIADRLGVCQKTVDRWHTGRSRLPFPLKGTL